MSYQKKRYSSSLFGADVWIVNVGVEQALSDPEIADSGLSVFTNDEIARMKTVPTEEKHEVFQRIFLAKKHFPGATVTHIGAIIPLGPEIDIREEKIPTKPEPPKKKKRRPPTLEEADVLGQTRLVGLT